MSFNSEGKELNKLAPLWETLDLAYSVLTKGNFKSELEDLVVGMLYSGAETGYRKHVDNPNLDG